MRTACNHCGREISPTSGDWWCSACGVKHDTNIRTHFVDFSLMGVMKGVPEYKSGDSISYGGMIYRPSPDGRMVHTRGNGSYHELEILKWLSELGG